MTKFIKCSKVYIFKLELFLYHIYKNNIYILQIKYFVFVQSTLEYLQCNDSHLFFAGYWIMDFIKDNRFIWLNDAESWKTESWKKCNSSIPVLEIHQAIEKKNDLTIWGGGDRTRSYNDHLITERNCTFRQFSFVFYRSVTVLIAKNKHKDVLDADGPHCCGESFYKL